MAAARRSIDPTSVSSSALRSLSVETCFVGMMRTCSGAWGLISRKATSESSRYASLAGIEPATMRQKRQSLMSMNLALEEERASDALQVGARRVQPQLTPGARERDDIVFLAQADFHHQPAVWAKLVY